MKEMGKTQKRSDKDHRQQITPEQVSNIVDLTEDRLFARLNEKGYGAWVSQHEILGFLTEEYHETIEAVHSKSVEDLRTELVDIAVGCIFGIACIEAKAHSDYDVSGIASISKCKNYLKTYP